MAALTKTLELYIVVEYPKEDGKPILKYPPVEFRASPHPYCPEVMQYTRMATLNAMCCIKDTKLWLVEKRKGRRDELTGKTYDSDICLGSVVIDRVPPATYTFKCPTSHETPAFTFHMWSCWTPILMVEPARITFMLPETIMFDEIRHPLPPEPLDDTPIDNAPELNRGNNNDPKQ